MIIEIDRRAGSEGLAGPIGKTPGIQVKLTTLEYGDVAFIGQGPKSRVRVGIEYKLLGDMLACMKDGRFSGHQLPGMVKMYDYRWLILESVHQTGPHGELQVWRGGWTDPRGARVMYKDLDNFLNTIEIRGGFRVKRTGNQAETVAVILDLYRWWQKPWDGHHSHLRFDGSDAPDASLLSRPGLARLVAKELPGVGWKRSGAAVRCMGTVQAMVEASEEEWQRVPGIGKDTARRIVSAKGWRE